MGVHAQLFADAGATVVITDVREQDGIATAAAVGENCQFMAHDVSSEAQWTSTINSVVERYGRIDVLVNNAGIGSGGGLLDTSLAEWGRLVSVNQTGVFLGMRAVAPAMEKAGGGSIVNLSSIAGLKSAPRAHAYSATKWAVRGMSKSAAVELAPMGIRVNSVHPGLVDTEMLTDATDSANLARLLSGVPLGRLASPREVGQLVLFLASDDSAYCTGHEFTIDGGLTA